MAGKGGTIYDPGLRETLPNRGNTDVQTGRSTQVYPDGYRHSGGGGTNPHWTNQGVPKGDPGRHSPPPDRR